MKIQCAYQNPSSSIQCSSFSLAICGKISFSMLVGLNYKMLMKLSFTETLFFCFHLSILKLWPLFYLSQMVWKCTFQRWFCWIRILEVSQRTFQSGLISSRKQQRRIYLAHRLWWPENEMFSKVMMGTSFQIKKSNYSRVLLTMEN